MDQSEFLSSIIDFLHKYSTQFHETLLTNSIVLEHLHSKSKRLFLENSSKQDSNQSLHQAFQSFIQTLNDEHQQLNQRMEFLRNLQQQIKMNKETFDHCTSSNKNRQYLARFLHRIQKHRKAPLLSSEKCQEIITQITDLLWSFSSPIESNSIDLKKPLPDKDHSLHLSDLSFTTDYYSENEID